jgi:hypothetical protein
MRLTPGSPAATPPVPRRRGWQSLTVLPARTQQPRLRGAVRDHRRPIDEWPASPCCCPQGEMQPDLSQVTTPGGPRGRPRQRSAGLARRPRESVGAVAVAEPLLLAQNSTFQVRVVGKLHRESSTCQQPKDRRHRHPQSTHSRLSSQHGGLTVMRSRWPILVPLPLFTDAPQPAVCSCGAVAVQFSGTVSVIQGTTQAAEQHKHAPDRREGAHSEQRLLPRPAGALSVNRALIICTGGSMRRLPARQQAV